MGYDFLGANYGADQVKEAIDWAKLLKDMDKVAARLKTLYIFMYDYYTNVKGLNNLIWVWNDSNVEGFKENFTHKDNFWTGEYHNINVHKKEVYDSDFVITLDEIKIK